MYTAVHASTQPYTRAMYTARTWLCKCSCTRAVYPAVVYKAGRLTGPCRRSQTACYGRVRPATAVCGLLRPCTRPIHSPFTAVYTAVYDGCYTAVRHVHTSTTQLKGRVRAMYTAAYTGRDSTLRPWAVYTAVTRHVHGRVHVPYRAVYVFVYTGRVHGRSRPHTAVAGRTRP